MSPWRDDQCVPFSASLDLRHPVCRQAEPHAGGRIEHDGPADRVALVGAMPASSRGLVFGSGFGSDFGSGFGAGLLRRRRAGFAVVAQCRLRHGAAALVGRRWQGGEAGLTGCGFGLAALPGRSGLVGSNG